METVSRTKLKEIFEAATNLPVSERAAFLDHCCADNINIRNEIKRLLAADDAVGSFLESSPFDEAVISLAEIRARNYIGQKIGAYQIECEIGAGGMGTVFLAARDLGDFQQKAAFKIVHQGAHSKEIIRRFLIERKILAALEHSNIARLIDAGQTAEGLPLLVMEYVAGKPLDEYCRTQNCSLDERLKLFRKICVAVAYAHRRLIIHRDLKPSNILVTADGEPKLLDFGIAKLLLPIDPALKQTATLMNLLTPAYAAPEQIRGASITTATDIYSLGVILYELLTGVLPYDLKDKTLDKVFEIISQTETAKPSENPRSTIRTAPLKGDLDNIILKSLRKDPERRYQSVEQLSEGDFHK